VYKLLLLTVITIFISDAVRQEKFTAREVSSDATALVIRQGVFPEFKLDHVPGS
jgi:hypothetical protein